MSVINRDNIADAGFDCVLPGFEAVYQRRIGDLEIQVYFQGPDAGQVSLRMIGSKQVYYPPKTTWLLDDLKLLCLVFEE